MLKWQEQLGYNENGEIVAFISFTLNKLGMKVKVRGGKAADNYFVENTIVYASGNVAKQVAEITYRIIKNQPDKDAAQAALRAYARMKGDFWWEDP
jgi:hypothetical protein